MKKIFFCCIILLFAFACKKGNNNNNNGVNENATDLFPDKPGDTWLYLVNDTAVYTLNGQSNTVSQYYTTVSVIDSVRLPESIHGIPLPKGTEANIWVYNYPEGTDTNYVYHTGDTLVFFEIHQTSKSYARQYVVPLILHNSWHYTVGSFAEVAVDSQDNIIVGQNHFDNAFHIEGYGGMPGEGFSVEEWIKDNIGMVKRYLQTDGTSGVNHFTKWSLISYHLK
jgi:hypothetical protein